MVSFSNHSLHDLLCQKDVMEEHIVEILKAEYVTHNVKRFTLEKPKDYKFKPGQATEISINLPEWREKKRPFSFTCLNDWSTLEFTIKIYSDHDGVTNQLGKLKLGDKLILHEVFGAINYYDEGVFIAGGAGVTPFIAIFRQLQENRILGGSKLIFSNKTSKDIILNEEFSNMLGDNFINTLTEEKTDQYDNRIIDEAYLREKIDDFSKYFYICGPDPMILSIQESLLNLGAQKEKVIIEQF